jgi:hypothetical protein
VIGGRVATSLGDVAPMMGVALGLAALLAVLVWLLVRRRGRLLAAFAPTLAGRVTGMQLTGVRHGIPFRLWLLSSRAVLIDLGVTPRLQRQLRARRPDLIERWWWRRFGGFAAWPAVADDRLAIQIQPRRLAARLQQNPAVRSALLAIVDGHRASVIADSRGLRLVVRSASKTSLQATRLAEVMDLAAELPALLIEHGATAHVPLSPVDRRRMWKKLALVAPISLGSLIAFLLQVRQLRSEDGLVLMGFAAAAAVAFMALGELIVRWVVRVPPESRRKVRADVQLASMVAAGLLGAGACYANRAWDTSPIRHMHWRALSVEGRIVLLSSVADPQVTMRLRLAPQLIGQLTDSHSTIEIISRQGAFGWSYADIIGVDPSQ